MDLRDYVIIVDRPGVSNVYVFDQAVGGNYVVGPCAHPSTVTCRFAPIPREME